MPNSKFSFKGTLHTLRLITAAGAVWKATLLAKRFDRIGIALMLSLPTDIILGWMADPIFVYGVYISKQFEAVGFHALAVIALKIDFAFIWAYGALSALSLALAIGGAWYYIFFWFSKRSPAPIALGSTVAVYAITILWEAPVAALTKAMLHILPTSVQIVALPHAGFAISFVKVLTTALGIGFLALGARFQIVLYKELRTSGEKALGQKAVSRLIDQGWEMAPPWRLASKVVPVTIRRPDLKFRRELSINEARSQGKAIRSEGTKKLHTPGFIEKLLLNAYTLFNRFDREGARAPEDCTSTRHGAQTSYPERELPPADPSNTQSTAKSGSTRTQSRPHSQHASPRKQRKKRNKRKRRKGR